MTPLQFHALAAGLRQVLLSQSVIISTLAVEHPKLSALPECAKLASQAADLVSLAMANVATAVEPARDIIAEMDRAFLGINREGIWRNHTCYRCKDGTMPCPDNIRSPRDCPTLRARND